MYVNTGLTSTAKYFLTVKRSTTYIEVVVTAVIIEKYGEQ